MMTTAKDIKNTFPLSASTELCSEIVTTMLILYERNELSTENVVEGLWRLYKEAIPGIGINTETLRIINQAFAEVL